MKTILLLSFVLVACGKESPTPAPAPTPTPAPAPDKQPGLTLQGEPIKQAVDFPKHRWVRTVLFGGNRPYIGFTYVDRTKGNSIKGEEIGGLSDDEIKKRLGGKFPSSTMQPIPEGHPMTLLTDEEIKKYGLPAEPEWLSYFK